jgi:hypothetical protein
MQGLIRARDRFRSYASTYIAMGTVWKQKIPSYDDGLALMKIFRDDYRPPGNPDDFSLVEIFAYLHESGIMAKGFGLILTPAFGFSWWNRFLMWIHGIKWEERIRCFDQNQIAEIANDFFVRNSKWIGGYLSFASGSVSSRSTIPIIRGIASLSNPLTSSPMAPSMPPSGF